MRRADFLSNRASIKKTYEHLDADGPAGQGKLMA
jgi:hypothetical protein